jgi:hypothetical protein
MSLHPMHKRYGYCTVQYGSTTDVLPLPLLLVVVVVVKAEADSYDGNGRRSGNELRP